MSRFISAFAFALAAVVFAPSGLVVIQSAPDFEQADALYVVGGLMLALAVLCLIVAGILAAYRPQR